MSICENCELVEVFDRLCKDSQRKVLKKLLECWGVSGEGIDKILRGKA